MKYLWAGLSLLLILFIISNFGMWLVQEFLDHFDGRKYGDAHALADDTWIKPAETEAQTPVTAAVAETDSEAELLDAVLLDGNRLNDIQRFQILAELSLKRYGSYFGEYLDREPIEEIELSKDQAGDYVLQFLELLKSFSAPEYIPYQAKDGFKLDFRADKSHPSVSLWVADLSGYGCTAFLYLDARTGLPIRFRASYSSHEAEYDLSSLFENNVYVMDEVRLDRSWQTGNPVFVELLQSYMAGFLGVNFYSNAVFDNGLVEQWMTDDYRYVLTWASGNSPDHRKKFDLVLSPMDGQETIRQAFSEPYGYLGYQREIVINEAEEGE